MMQLSQLVYVLEFQLLQEQGIYPLKRLGVG